VKTKPKISAYTLGCKLNFAETSSIVRQFLDNGYELVPYGQKADVTILNTCTVTAQADKKTRKSIHKAAKLADHVIVLGCSAQLHIDEYSKIEGVDLVLGVKDKFRAYELFEKQQRGAYSCESNLVESFDHAFSTAGRTRSFLKVQDGCDYKCSYCIIPKARGKSRNAPVSEIIDDAKKIAAEGYKEIILTGVNIGHFGKSTGETFLDLLKALDREVDIPRIRISSVEPELLSEDIIRLVAGSGKFLPHFHIPLQSGSDEILRLMRRRYNTKLFASRLELIKKIIPDAFIGVDVIVGFPGETDSLFEQTYEFLTAMPFTYLHIFPYSDRPGTPASMMDAKVDYNTKIEREKRLRSLSDQKHEQFYKDNLGKEYNVLFETKTKEGNLTGFTDNYIRVQANIPADFVNTIHKVRLQSISGNGIVQARVL